MLRLLGVPRSLMPEVRSSSEAYGRVATTLGVAGTPVGGIAGTSRPLSSARCASPLGSPSAPTAPGASCCRTWHDGPALTQPSPHDRRLEAERRHRVRARGQRLPDNGGVFRVPAFAGLGAPHWDSHARGTLVGLTRGASAGHVARAALEAIAYQVSDLAEAMQADAGVRLSECCGSTAPRPQQPADAVPGGRPGGAGGARRW